MSRRKKREENRERAEVANPAGGDVTSQASGPAPYEHLPSGPSMVGSFDPDRKYAGFTGVKTSGGRPRTREADSPE